MTNAGKALILPSDCSHEISSPKPLERAQDFFKLFKHDMQPFIVLANVRKFTTAYFSNHDVSMQSVWNELSSCSQFSRHRLVENEKTKCAAVETDGLSRLKAQVQAVCSLMERSLRARSK